MLATRGRTGAAQEVVMDDEPESARDADDALALSRLADDGCPQHDEPPAQDHAPADPAPAAPTEARPASRDRSN
jgi:hypothetical protein